MQGYGTFQGEKISGHSCVNIAICDDEEVQREYIEQLVCRWADTNGIYVETDTFESAEKYIKAGTGSGSTSSGFISGERYDILLLDIQMDGISGVELAKELRKTDEHLIIIFITAVPDFIQEGYDVSALHYLMKPLDEGKLMAVLDRAVKQLAVPDKTLIVQSGGETIRIAHADIFYIESFAHSLEVVTKSGCFTIKMPAYKLEEQLDNNFIRCHRSYIVNIRHINKITKTDVVIDDRKTLPLSRRLYSEVQKAWINYFKSIRSDNST